MPAVSVIIPAYNQGAYLKRAIRSVLSQTYPDFEVIVVDDGSTDNTPEVARSFNDSRLRYIYQENRGLSAARNTGIRHTTAPLLTFLDSDDLFLPEKLALLSAELEKHPEIGLVAGQAIPIDENEKQVGKIFDRRPPEDASRLLLGNPLHVGSVMLRRECQESVGFFDENLRSYEDWDMWLRLALAGCQIGWVPAPVSLYRFHRAQMTRLGGQMTTATFMVLDKLYSRTDLPEAWLALRSQAYSNAHLRAAAQAYLARSYAEAQAGLSRAVELNPSLAADGARALAAHFVAWTELPKVGDPLVFLEEVYTHLPTCLENLASRRREELGRAAMKTAFEAYRAGDLSAARAACQRAFRYQPRWLANRGALAIWAKSLFSSSRPQA